MIGNKHENLIDFVVRDNLSLLKFLGFEPSQDVTVRSARGLDLDEATPKQLLADACIILGEPPTLGLVIEVQTTMTNKDWAEKQFKWPHYAIGLRTELRCRTETLVITTDRRIEKLARKPIQIGRNSVWHAMVLGPSDLPKEPSTDFTRRNPTLALLAMMAHGRTYTSPEPPANMLKGLWESDLYQALENHHQRVYYDKAMQALPLWIALALKDDPMTQEYFSPIVLDYIAEGMEKGIEQGREQGLRECILLLLGARGYSPSEADLQRIENEHDKSVLETWVKAAADQVAGQPFFDDH